MGENVLGQALEIVVSLRVVRHGRIVGLPGTATVRGVVLKAEKRNDPLQKRVQGCHQIWRENGMCAFVDWLRLYNNLVDKPYLEAIKSVQDFYTGLGIDLFKYTVSMPGSQ